MATMNTPLAPSVEKAYYRKCIELKRRLNEVEEANDAARVRRMRLERAVLKIRLERAFLLDQLAKQTEVDTIKDEAIDVEEAEIKLRKRDEVDELLREEYDRDMDDDAAADRHKRKRSSAKRASSPAQHTPKAKSQGNSTSTRLPRRASRAEEEVDDDDDDDEVDDDDDDAADKALDDDQSNASDRGNDEVTVYDLYNDADRMDVEQNGTTTKTAHEGSDI